MEQVKKPHYLLFCHWQGDRVGFTIIKHMNIMQAKRFYDYHLLVNGKAASVWCFFSDHDITKEDLKATAIRFMKGDYIEISIDLDTFEKSIKEGIDRTKTPLH